MDKNFNCPDCGMSLPTDATECHHCGWHPNRTRTYSWMATLMVMMVVLTIIGVISLFMKNAN